MNSKIIVMLAEQGTDGGWIRVLARSQDPGLLARVVEHVNADLARENRAIIRDLAATVRKSKRGPARKT